ncbi:MAG TPA: hypothetical protein VK843_23365 [Planctomycetota bacterium]|nr:hypothetical protein [Planctomycetota bacterium]
MSEIHFPATEIVHLTAVGNRRARQQRRSDGRKETPRDESSELIAPSSDARDRDAAAENEGTIDVLA